MDNKPIFYLLALTFLIASVWGLVFGTTLFYTGYHNLDTGQNMRYLNAQHDLNLVDTYSFDNVIDSNDAYSLGVAQLRFGFLIFGSSACLFGYSIGALVLFTPKDKKKKKKLIL